MEEIIQEISLGIMVIFPMLILLAIIFNKVRSHSIAVITIIWSLLFAFVYLSSLLNSVHSSMKSYLLWFEMLHGMNGDAWLCLGYYVLIGIAATKTIVKAIEENTIQKKKKIHF